LRAKVESRPQADFPTRATIRWRPVLSKPDSTALFRLSAIRVRRRSSERIQNSELEDRPSNNSSCCIFWRHLHCYTGGSSRVTRIIRGRADCSASADWTSLNKSPVENRSSVPVGRPAQGQWRSIDPTSEQRRDASATCGPRVDLLDSGFSNSEFSAFGCGFLQLKFCGPHAPAMARIPPCGRR
jgi:hypothetical protein